MPQTCCCRGATRSSCCSTYPILSSRSSSKWTPLASLGVRVHGSMEVLDRFGDGCFLERDRLILHALEHQSIALAAPVLVPTRTYYERYYRSLYGLESERVVVSQPPKAPLPRVRVQSP